jgi:hypothetical protein
MALAAALTSQGHTCYMLAASTCCSLATSWARWPYTNSFRVGLSGVFMQEEEARLKPGTMKAIAFGVIKERGVEAPVSAEEIVRITTTDGTRIDWPDKSKKLLQHVSNDPDMACAVGDVWWFCGGKTPPACLI